MPRYKRPLVPKFKVPDLDIREVRRALGLTQEQFAAFAGISVRTIQAWERRHWQRTEEGEKPVNSFCWKQVRFREPSNPARVLIALVARDPWVIHDIMTGQMKRWTRTAPRLADSIDTDWGTLKRHWKMA
jgi:Helix-turn-helix